MSGEATEADVDIFGKALKLSGEVAPVPASLVLKLRVTRAGVWRLKLRQHRSYVLLLMSSGVIALA